MSATAYHAGAERPSASPADPREGRHLRDRVENSVSYVRTLLNVAQRIQSKSETEISASAEEQLARAKVASKVMDILLPRQDNRGWLEVIAEEPKPPKLTKDGFDVHISENAGYARAVLTSMEEEGHPMFAIQAGRFTLERLVPPPPQPPLELVP